LLFKVTDLGILLAKLAGDVLSASFATVQLRLKIFYNLVFAGKMFFQLGT
jgi:hypothetical protein